MSREAVLVVEDEVPTRAFLEQQLADDGYEVLAAEGAGEALELVEAARPDLVLLDATLPDGSGFEVCSRLREGEPGRSWNRDIPVIIVSARADPVDRCRGFARGCDDYVTKPFVYEELLARMRAVLRRAAGPRRERLSVLDLAVDLGSRSVRIDGEPVQLSAKEYDLLVALAADPERVFRKEELLRDVWGFRSLGSRRKKRLTLLLHPSGRGVRMPPRCFCDGEAVSPLLYSCAALGLGGHHPLDPGAFARRR